MITQAIKQWLHKLFAWWPWRKSVENDYSQPVGNVNLGAAQESMWRSMYDGPVPQTGMTSVVVEQGRDGAPEAADWSPAEEYLVQPPQPPAEESTNSAPLSSADPFQETQTSKGEKPAPSPTFEQRLVFLRYMVKRGLINEGFAEGQDPSSIEENRIVPSKR
jgi:hypothetical protein